MAENKSNAERLYLINETLLQIAEKELENKKVPSKEVLDTIKLSLVISASFPWSKFDDLA